MEKFVMVPHDKYQRLLEGTASRKKEEDNVITKKTPGSRLSDEINQKAPMAMRPPPGKRLSEEDKPPSKKNKGQIPKITKLPLNWISL